MSEPTLKEMPLLEYTLKRYAYNLAKRLGISTDLVDEKWDEIVDKNLTYWENKERVKEYLLNLARPEKRLEAKEFMAEIERYEEETIHRQLEYLLYTLRDILQGNTYSEYYELAESSGLLDEPISRWIKDIESWKWIAIRGSYVKKFQSLIDELIEIQLRLSAYEARHGDVPIKELVGKWDELFEELVKTEVKVEEEEIELRPIIVRRKGIQAKLPIEEAKEEVKEVEKELEEAKVKPIEEMTETESLELIKELEQKIKAYTKLPMKERYKKLKELKPQIEKILKLDMFEAKALAYYYKQAVYPLSVYFKESEEFRFLKDVKPVIEVIWR